MYICIFMEPVYVYIDPCNSEASLGNYTAYVYLFQEPLFRSIDAFVPLEHSAEGFAMVSKSDLFKC